MASPAQDESVVDVLAVLGGREAVYVVDLVRLVQLVERVPDAASGVLRAVDGRRSLERVLASSGIGEAQALALVQALASDGILRLVGGARTYVIAKPKHVPLPKDDESVGTWGDELTIIEIPVLGG